MSFRDNVIKLIYRFMYAVSEDIIKCIAKELDFSL